MNEVAESNGVVEQYDDQWFAQHGIDDERVIDALNEVPRKPFVTIGADDEGEPLPAASLPPVDVVAKLLTSLQLTAGDTILEIGTDTGYVTALLARLGAEVYSVERRLQMAKLAEGRLAELEIENVDILYGPRLTEYALNAPYHAIVMSAVAPRVPEKLKSRLAIDGRMVIPVGDGNKNPEVVCIRRLDDETYERTSLGQLRFSSKLGDILVELGIADRDDIELAALEADVSGQRLGEALLEYSHVQETDLVRALAIQRGFKMAPVDTLLKISDHELSYSVPRAFLEHHQLIPLVVQERELTVATVDPDAPTVELARLLDADSVDTYLITSDEFHRIWNTILEGRRPQKAQEDNLKTRVEAKFEKILRIATRLQANTIHIDNQPDGGNVRFRLGDELRPIPETAFEPSEVNYLIEFLKMGANLETLQEHLPQRGRFSWVREPVTYHLHVHVMPSIMGEQLSLQLLSHGAEAPSFEAIGFPDYFVEDIEILLEQVPGLFLIVGPRHAAKKQTLYALVSQLASDGTRKVGTVESDVLCPIPDVQQLLVHPEDDFGYKEAIHEYLRFDTDIIALDEIPNPAVAMEALSAARRGSILLGTLHGKDAGHVVEGMRQFGVPSEALANGISGILTQWMAPAICEDCRELVKLKQEQIDHYFPVGPPMGVKAFGGTGCASCSYTGTDGRMPVLELLPFGDSLRQAVIANQPEKVLRQIAADSGVEMLSDYAVQLAIEGKIPIDELVNYTALDE